MTKVDQRAKYYRVLVEGKNILFHDTETPVLRRVGFYTTRFVKASDPDTAATQATALAARELDEARPMNEVSNAPTMAAIEVEEVPLERVEEVKGFTFFLEESN